MKKIIALLMGITLCLLAGCNANTPAPVSPAPEPNLEEKEPTTDENSTEATLYIGMAGEFSEYRVTPQGADFENSEEASLFLEDLMHQMGSLTGWNLDCDISVYKTVGVAFLEESTLFVGPPEEQKEEFHLFDAHQMVQTILDSVAKTIQMNLSPQNPDAIEVYFSTADNLELTFPNIDMCVPIGENYTGLVPLAETIE